MEEPSYQGPCELLRSRQAPNRQSSSSPLPHPDRTQAGRSGVQRHGDRQRLARQQAPPQLLRDLRIVRRAHHWHLHGAAVALKLGHNVAASASTQQVLLQAGQPCMHT